MLGAKQRVVESRQYHSAEQFVHKFAAAAVGKKYSRIIRQGQRTGQDEVVGGLGGGIHVVLGVMGVDTCNTRHRPLRKKPLLHPTDARACSASRTLDIHVASVDPGEPIRPNNREILPRQAL